MNGSAPVTVEFTVALPVDKAWALLTTPRASMVWLGAERVEVGCDIRPPRRVDVPGRITAVHGSGFDVEFGGGRRASITLATTEKGTTVRIVEDAPAADSSAVEASWRWCSEAARQLVATVKQRAAPLQAVIVVHGVGEHTPGATIRGFAEAMLGDDHYFSKPDRFADSYELRRLQALMTETRPRTDFFEYYWAHRIEDTKAEQVKAWTRALLLRPPRTVSPQLRTLYRTIRLLTYLALAATVVLVVALAIAIGIDGVRGVFDTVSGWRNLAVVSLVTGIVSGAVAGFLVSRLGDAARYLSPRPANIAVRQAIREQGVALLRRLHETGEYHRIVVVGHSLGSVIAYDILTHYWVETHTHLDGPGKRPQPALAAYEALPDDATVDQHHDAQHGLWHEFRTLGHPWLVTDFVTLGSPLTHAQLLMADSAEDLAAKRRQRELPTCPPQWDRRPDAPPPRPGRRRYSFSRSYLADTGWETRRVLHHAALFGPTRWTNLYFPAAFGVFGDLIGGPVGDVFRRDGDDGGLPTVAIRDVAVSSSRRLRSRTPRAHSDYWRPSPGPAPHDDALTRLQAAVDLDCNEWLTRTIDGLPMSTLLPTSDVELR